MFGRSSVGIRVDTVGLLAVLLLLMPGFLLAESSEESLPVITVIIDDMGNHGGWGEKALAIPGSVTYSFLPHTPFAERLAQRANALNKEVMLHLPMESHEGKRLGPGGLTLHLTEQAFKRRLLEGLNAVPYARGINNHMGSLLTRHPGAMSWLMEGILTLGDLYFIDSRTSVQSVGLSSALEHGVPSAGRDVFLDNVRDPEAIRTQFMQLVQRARKHGHAIGIGHPYPETSEVLSELLAEPELLGVRLISASQMIEHQREKQRWLEPSSPSPKVAKNSKQ
jgi:polysaccharide deacetylase 2 family uncharacterized protein YibQ